MSSTDYEFQTSFKTNGGTLINVPANTPDEARTKMEHLRALAQDIVATEQILNGASNAGAVVGGAPPPYPPAAAPPQAPPPPPSADPWATAAPPSNVPAPPAAQPGSPQSCLHGAYVWKDFIAKSSGKQMRGWFCPSPQRTECKPEWAN